MSRARARRTLLHIDWTRCEARGACLEILEGVLAPDEDGFPAAVDRPLSEHSDVPLRTGELSPAREAVGACPRMALHLRTVRR